MTGAILGKKIGMTSFFNKEGTKVPCTVIEAGPCPVVQVKTAETDGYTSVQIGFEQIREKKVNKPLKGHFAKASINPTRYLKEFRAPNKDYKVGEELTVEQFIVGDKVIVSGNSKGKGFQGVMKRHGFGGVGMATHGQSNRQRHPGSIGQSSYPSRVMKGLKMAGRMGGKRVTVRNIEVLEIIPEQNLLILKGCVPGASNSLIEIVK